jgi:hypothetical protein
MSVTTQVNEETPLIKLVQCRNRHTKWMTLSPRAGVTMNPLSRVRGAQFGCPEHGRLGSLCGRTTPSPTPLEGLRLALHLVVELCRAHEARERANHCAVILGIRNFVELRHRIAVGCILHRHKHVGNTHFKRTSAESESSVACWLFQPNRPIPNRLFASSTGTRTIVPRIEDSCPL